MTTFHQGMPLDLEAAAHLWEPQVQHAYGVNQRNEFAGGPAVRLCAGMLDRAVYDLRRYWYCQTFAELALAVDAARWIQDEPRRKCEQKWPFRFQTIAAALGCDPDALREQIFRGRDPGNLEYRFDKLLHTSRHQHRIGNPVGRKHYPPKNPPKPKRRRRRRRRKRRASA